MLPLLLVGCSKFQGTKTTELEKSSHSIPIERAVLVLEDYLEQKQQITKSDQTIRVISSSFSINPSALGTKSNSNLPEDCETLVHVVNFENGEGFAVLSGDDRISAPIICVTDMGEMSQSEMLLAFQDEGRTYYEGYPMSGDAFMVHPDYPDEIFLNPNTFNFYDSQHNDAYVGDFRISDSQNDTTDIDLSSESFIGKLCVAFALDEVGGQVGGNMGEIGDWNDNPSIGGGSGLPNDDHESVIKTYYSLPVDSAYVEPLLVDYTIWDQESPFNDYCPDVRQWLLFGQTIKAAAGCFPLAIAKVMAHFEHPTSISYQGMAPTVWASLDADYLIENNYNTLSCHSAASLLRYIGQLCGSIYFPLGTFTFPYMARNFLSSIGYINATVNEYNTEHVIENLNDGEPVIVFSVPRDANNDIDLLSSHAWNIDGYSKYQKYEKRHIYQNGSYVRTEEEALDEYFYMVHCDYGWGGSCNGDFVSGVFKVDNYNYNWYLKTLTYDYE